MEEEYLIKVERPDEEEEDPLRDDDEEEVVEQKFVIPENDPKHNSRRRPGLTKKTKPTKCRSRKDMTEEERLILVERDAKYRRKKLMAQLKLSGDRLTVSVEDDLEQPQRKSARLRNVVPTKSRFSSAERQEKSCSSGGGEGVEGEKKYVIPCSGSKKKSCKPLTEEELGRARKLNLKYKRKQREARLNAAENPKAAKKPKLQSRKDMAEEQLKQVSEHKRKKREEEALLLKRAAEYLTSTEYFPEVKPKARPIGRRRPLEKTTIKWRSRKEMSEEERQNLVERDARYIRKKLAAEMLAAAVRMEAQDDYDEEEEEEDILSDNNNIEQVQQVKAEDGAGFNEDKKEMKADAEEVLKRRRALKALRARERRARMTPEERDNYLARKRASRRREREKKREGQPRLRVKKESVPKPQVPINTGDNSRRRYITQEEHRLEMRYAAALTFRRNRPQDYIGNEVREADFLALEKARFKALEERHRRRYNLPEMTEAERAQWIEKQKEKGDKQSLYNLQRKATLTEEQKQERRIKQYLQRQAYRARNPDNVPPPEVVERRQELFRQWRQSLTGEKLQRYKESLKRANQKQCEKFKQNPALRAKNETPERKAYKLLRQRLFERRRKLRKDMRKGGCSEEEIAAKVEELTKKFCQENSYTPTPVGKPRKPIAPIDDSERVQTKVAHQSTNLASIPRHNIQNANHTIFLPSSNISVGSSSANQYHPQLFATSNPNVSSSSVSHTSTAELVTTSSSQLQRQADDTLEQKPFERSISPGTGNDVDDNRQAENEEEDEEKNGDLDSMEASFQDDFDGDYDDDYNCADNVEDAISLREQSSSVPAPVRSPELTQVDKIDSPKDVKREEREKEVVPEPEAEATQTKPEQGRVRKIFFGSEMCEECGKIFSDHRKYLNHRRHYHRAPRKCPHPQCNFEYIFSRKLWKHFRQVHVRNECGPMSKKPKPPPESLSSENFSNICPECGKIFKTKCTVDDHIRRVHQGKGFHCDLCRSGGDLQSAGKLWKHKVEKHGLTDLPPPPNLEVTECEYCGERVLRSYKHHVLKKHPEMKHKLPDFQLELEVRSEISKVEEASTPGYCRCPKCPKEFATHRVLMRHLRHVHEMGQQTRHPCPHCGFMFKQKYVMTKHAPLCLAKQAGEEIPKVSSSEGKPAYKSTSCVLCGAWFFTKPELREHLQNSHPKEYESIEKRKNPGEIPLECEHCSNESTQFDDKDQLREHLESAHPDKSLKCPNVKCRKVMLSSVELALHITLEHVKIANKKGVRKPRPHSRKKLPPPTCFRCQEEFATPKEVAEHVKLAHPSCFFPCPHCSGMYYSQRVLDFHVVLNCRKNPDRAKSRKEIADAGRTPLNMVRVKCKLCSVFKAVISLSSHLKGVHKITENSFECEHCQRIFRTREFWVSHLENEHGTLVESVYDVITGEEEDGELIKKKEQGRNKKRKPSPKKKSKSGRGNSCKRAKRRSRRHYDSPAEVDEDEDDEVEEFHETESSKKQPTRRSQRKVRPARGSRLQNDDTITQCSVRLVRMSDDEINSFLRK